MEVFNKEGRVIYTTERPSPKVWGSNRGIFGKSFVVLIFASLGLLAMGAITAVFVLFFGTVAFGTLTSFFKKSLSGPRG